MADLFLQRQWDILINRLVADPDYFSHFPNLQSLQIQIIYPRDRTAFTIDRIKIFIKAVQRASFSSVSLQMFTNLDVQDKYMQYFLEQLRTVSDKFYHCPLYPPKPQHKIKKMAKVKEVSEQWHIFINKLKEDPDYFTHFPKLYSVQIQIIDTMDRQTFTFDSIRIFIEAVKKTTFSSASLQIFTNQDEDKQKHMQYFLEQLSTVSDKFSQCQTQNLIEIDGGSALKI